MFRSFLKLIVVSLFAACASQSVAQAQQHPPFDGTLNGWETGAGKPVTQGWEIVEGMLHLKKEAPRGGNIFSIDEFGDFDLSFEWKIAPKGNNGLKYRVRAYGTRLLGLEYQIYDDPGAKNRVQSKNSAGAIYDLYEPNELKALKPAGEFNTARIVLRGDSIEHWLNGQKIVSATIGDDEWQKRVAASKFNEYPEFARNRRGKLMITDHGGEVWYRNFVFKTGDDAAPSSKENEQEQTKANAKYDLYLLIGQSNMAGRGVVEELDKQPHARVMMFTEDQTWAPALDPLHFDKPIAGVGLGSTFGRVMADAKPNVTIGLVPCAVGGTPLSRWQREGDLYKQAVERAEAAMRDGTLRGILWHQGEADSGKEETAKSYGERLAQMVTDLRAELGAGDVPFVAGELGRFLAPERDGKPSYWPLVNEQLHTLPTRIKRTAIASSADLKHKGDGVHFESASLREFGRRYAAAMRELQK